MRFISKADLSSALGYSMVCEAFQRLDAVVPFTRIQNIHKNQWFPFRNEGQQ